MKAQSCVFSRLFAHKKGGGSTSNGRDSAGRRLGAKAADGQFYGTVPDDALGVEKKIYINTNVKGTHSLASYVPAGEIATVTLNDEALKYAKQGKIKISVGMTMVNADGYAHNHGTENRMPYIIRVTVVIAW